MADVVFWVARVVDERADGAFFGDYFGFAGGDLALLPSELFLAGDEADNVDVGRLGARLVKMNVYLPATTVAGVVFAAMFCL